MGRPFAPFAAAVLLAILPLAAFAQVSPGTVLTGTMDQNYSSNHVHAGDPFTISNAHSADYHINGATIYGHVASAQAAGQGTPGKIVLAFDKLVTRAGNTYRIEGYASKIDVQTKSNASKELGGAAAGALVGGLIGHGVGAIIGAGGGAVAAKNNRQNVMIPQGSSVSVQIERSRRQS